MAGSRSSDVQIALVSTREEFASLREDWNALAAASAASSVFLTHEWFDAAWQWKGRDCGLHTLIARRAGRLVGVFPLVLAKQRSRAGTRRTLEFLTVPDTQLCDLIIAPGEQETLVEAFAAVLADMQAHWDVLDLAYLPQPSVAAAGLASAFRRRAHPLRIGPGGSNPYVDLQGSWEAYYGTRSRSLKKASNLAANRLKKAGTVRIARHEPSAMDAAGLGGLMNTLVNISARSWKRTTGNSLDNAGPQAFIRRLTELAAARGWLTVWTLELDGRPLAMEYQLVFEGNVHALRSDFDEATGEISPGSHLNRHLLEIMFDGRLTRYHMGPGESAYKLRWTEAAAPLERMTVYSRSARGRFAAFVDLRILPLLRALRATLRRAPAAESKRMA